MKTLAFVDHDLLGDLVACDKRLSAICHAAVRYRSAIRGDITRLRAGADPGPIRAVLEQWGKCLRDIKRIAREL